MGGNDLVGGTTAYSINKGYQMPAMTPKPFDKYTVAQQKFIDQYTRKLCVVWCDFYLNFDRMPEDDGTGRAAVYVEYAKSKKWITQDGSAVLSAGWQTAAAFLKR